MPYLLVGKTARNGLFYLKLSPFASLFWYSWYVTSVPQILSQKIKKDP